MCCAILFSTEDHHTKEDAIAEIRTKIEAHEADHDEAQTPTDEAAHDEAQTPTDEAAHDEGTDPN
jgi:hypothetical protein